MERSVIISLSLLLIVAAVAMSQSGEGIREGEAIAFGFVGAVCAIRYALKGIVEGRRAAGRLHARWNYRMLVAKYRRESRKPVFRTAANGDDGDGR